MQIDNWQSANDQIIKKLPYHVAEWLLEFGSLTEKLSREIGKEVKLDLLAEKNTVPAKNENMILGQEENSLAKIREVILHGPTKPWVFARTVVPSNSSYLIDQLGNRPLGNILFSDQSMRRESLQIRTIEKNDSLFISANDIEQLGANEFLWARRSLWKSSVKNKDLRLLVTEVFLPNSPLYDKS